MEVREVYESEMDVTNKGTIMFNQQPGVASKQNSSANQDTAEYRMESPKSQMRHGTMMTNEQSKSKENDIEDDNSKN